MPKSRRKNLLLTSSSLSQGFLLNPQTSLERPERKTNRQRYFANQTTSMRITETTTQKWKWNSFTRSCRMPHPTRAELSLSLQPWFLPIKESLSYQMTRFYVNKLSTMTSFGISKASKWYLERSRASLFSQQIGLRNKMLLAYILVVFRYLNLKFCMLQPLAKRLETLYLIWTSRVPIRSSRFRPPLSLLKVGHNRRSCWNFRRTTLKIGEGEGSCLILEMWDFMRCLGRKSVFRVKCLNIFATGCSSWCHCLCSAKKNFGNPKQSL